MRSQDYRMALGLTGAHRATREFPKPKPSNAAAKVGLMYERKIGRELGAFVKRGYLDDIEHNPWFTFYDSCGIGNCCPDFILTTPQGLIIVEVKLTWVEQALAKLNDLYLPVVSIALNAPVKPLVICRNVTPMAPRASYTLGDALTSREPLLHWPSSGHIQW